MINSNQTIANSINIVNSSSGQATISIVTTQQIVTVSAKPDENHFLNDINNPERTFTQLSYNNNPLDKIIIHRTSTSMPQIIYYNQEKTTDSHNQPSGLYSLSITGNGVIQILENEIQINNQKYNLLDISSIQNRYNMIKNNNLSQENFEKKIKDLDNTLELIAQSDKSSQLQVQIDVIKNEIHPSSINVQNAMQALKDMIKKIQNLQDHLADENALETDNQIQGIAIGLQTLEAGNALKNMQQAENVLSQNQNNTDVNNQISVVKNALQKLKFAINQKYNIQAHAGPEELISPNQQVNDEIAINNMQAMNNIGIGYNA